MSTVISFKRWAIAMGIAGALMGGLVGFSEQPAQAAEPSLAPPGCSCTISGGGSYDCASTSSCGAGTYQCTATCKDEETN